MAAPKSDFPRTQGFDEWYGIPRTYDESMWPAQNETGGMWPSIGNKQGWNPSIAPLEPIYEGRKGEKARQVGESNIDTRRTMEAEITRRAVDFIKRNASSGKPFYARQGAAGSAPWSVLSRPKATTLMLFLWRLVVVKGTEWRTKPIFLRCKLLTGYFFPAAEIFSVLEIPDLIATSSFRKTCVSWQEYCLYQDGEKVRCKMAKR